MTDPGRQAVFFDRDGTLIREVPFLSDPSGVDPLPGAADALGRLREAGYLLFLFTNQSGIGRGYFPAEAADACNRETERRLGILPGFDGIRVAPERPDEPPVYRKPSPRYLLETIAERDLDPSLCWMVGDRESDVEAGLRAGVGAARIGDPSAEKSDGVPVFPDVAAFVDWLLQG
jgi:D-glycero-D-manno-heptose 1,7-bisphosphate phosphatase